MADNVAITPGAGTSIATDDIGGVQYQRVKVTWGADGTANDVSSGNPLPVSGTFWQTTQPVSGTFWQATQPVSIAATVAVSGPLTDTQLRASAVPVSGTFWQSTQPVSGPLTDTQLRASAVPVSIASMPSTPVTGTFWQATQPVSGTVTANAGSGTFAVSGTFWQATQPVSIAATVATRDLKDNGRSCLAMTAEFTFAQTAETLLTMTLSVDGAATSTFSSRAVTNAKTFRIQSITLEAEALGSGTAPQRVYLRLRRNNSGATTASSPIQGVWSCVNNPAVVKTGTVQHFDFPDGIEIVGDGTKTFGFTLETPDFVATTATGRAKITALGFEY